MRHICVIGAGITGITTAYGLLQRGYDVTLFDKNRYAGMETSYANGGQLSASNAEVWNRWPTIFKALKSMTRADAPFLMNPMPSWHKFSWLAEFIAAIPHYRANTVQTTRLAIQARQYLFDIAARKTLRSIWKSGAFCISTGSARNSSMPGRSALCCPKAGLERREVAPADIRAIEPALGDDYYGAWYTPSDSTGDIHSFCAGLSEVCRSKGARLEYDCQVTGLKHGGNGVSIEWSRANGSFETLLADGVVICAGVASRRLGGMLGDRLNIYPVKGYSITIALEEEASRQGAPWVSILDDAAKIVTSRLGADRLRIAGTAELNGFSQDIRADRIRPLINWTRKTFPRVATEKVTPLVRPSPHDAEHDAESRRGQAAGRFLQHRTRPSGLDPRGGDRRNGCRHHSCGSRIKARLAGGLAGDLTHLMPIFAGIFAPSGSRDSKPDPPRPGLVASIALCAAKLPCNINGIVVGG